MRADDIRADIGRIMDEVARTVVFGIGRTTAQKILAATGVRVEQRVRDLSDADACPGAGVGGGAAPDHDGWLHLDLDAPITIDHSD